jgi:phospholipase D1/2
MAWHDVCRRFVIQIVPIEYCQVHMTIVGPSVLDIVQHFTERWNELKLRKHKDDE